MPKKYYTTFEISKICDVYPTTVINWINQKKLKAHTTPGGHHRVTREDLIEFLKEYNFPIPQELLDIKKKKIFIVDDDPTFLKLALKILSKNKDELDVKTFEDGYNALIEIGKNKPDLIVVDIVMPVMDGPTFCKKIKEDENLSDIKIIAISGESVLDKSIKNLVDVFLKKPINPDEFLKTVIKVVNLKS